ncbi:ATP-binding protein [Ignatzschineria rhizosphaerae]|uniref:ATP-binding protein n=1 Tax=Ignatzschineria rhizosphaerae TaxID=2923279 RepID=A0ABY3X196_9GAMM|nr:AAA family ATPase [Ignatzschineria rhizosphaerae]UNM95541.1 ATP-binding protein [Ignatzschineria rhizosphaerae]
MIIKYFSASYTGGITIEPLTFDQNMTLLVGPSGVGKTSILNAISDLKKVLRGSSINGFKWEVKINFNNTNYRWLGEFSYIEKNIFDELSKDPRESFIANLLSAIDKKVTDDDAKLISEQFYIDDKKILERSPTNFIFNKKNIKIKLPDNESSLNSLRDEPAIVEFISAIKRITILNNDYLSVEGLNIHHISPKRKKDVDLQNTDINISELKKLDWSIEKKLHFCEMHIPQVFSDITDRYKEIFPFVDSITVKEFIYPESATRYLILIKEIDNKNLISGDKLSSGMSKSLMLLCFFYLSNENIVFLIDEFENGLGINCLDEIVDMLSFEQYNQNIQFILTSHHPYIINNISMDSWKVIARDKSIIKSYDPVIDLNLNTSRHDAFLSLINSDVYEEGVFTS